MCENSENGWHVSVRDNTRRQEEAFFDSFEEAIEWVSGKGGRSIIILSHHERSVMIWYNDDKNYRIIFHDGREIRCSWEYIKNLL